MTPDITVIIVSWNTCDYLRRCLASLPRAVAAPERLCVHVVDNGSTDGTLEMVRSEFPWVRLDAAGENLGFARANNRALKACCTEYALLLNPDTEVRPGALDRLVAFMEREPRAGAAGPTLLNTDGSLQKAGDAFPTLIREVLCAPGLRSLRWLDGWRHRLTFQRRSFDHVVEVDGVLGACVLVRRAVWEQVGLLDERFFMYYEEIDWYRRMRAAGWQVFYVPEVVVVHHGGKSSGQRGLENSRIYFRSRYLYFRKHHGLLQAGLIALLNAMLLWGAEWKSRARRSPQPPAHPSP
ncbi:MAG: glycosyltransferase family 2 protein [Armatimonadetes bacterium]|nr:glycosyltransferase family 2 protein [Armatimonadota bacterium]